MMMGRCTQARRGAGRNAAFFLLLAAALGLALVWPNEKKPVQTGRDGYLLSSGAPGLAGRAAVLPRQTLLQGTLLLVDPGHPLPEDFPVPNTRAIRAMVGSYLPALEDVALWREAVYALCEMQVERPLEEGVTLSRGTLSPAQQETWRREAFARYLNVYPLSQALEKAQAAVPGGNESEHQTGYALDLEMTGVLRLSQADPLIRNDTGMWLAENMWRYGWIRRYGPDSQAEGACENVHLRYVGKVHAAAMHALSLDLEDYLTLLSLQGAMTVYRDNEPWAYLYALPCGGDLALPLPTDTEYQASLDNRGYAILAVAANGKF